MQSSHTVRRDFDVVMLTTIHLAADPRIFHREAKTLSQSGLAVGVIGQHPESEWLEGVWIEALPSPASRLRRLLLGLSLLRRARRLRGKLYIFHDLELFGVGLVLRLLGQKVIYDCHENTPMTMLQKSWIPFPLRYPAVLLVAVGEWLGSRLLTGVVTVNETLQTRFPRKRTIVVRNIPSAAVLGTLAQGPPLHSRANVVIYTGGLTRIRGIGELVEAFRSINSDAELWLLGDFVDPAFRQEILSSLPHNVRWFGHKEWGEVLRIYQSAKIGVALLHPTPNHRDAMPVKLFEYLAAGLPVIASDMPQYTQLLQGCGVRVNPKDVEQIRVTIERMLSDEAALAEMSRVGRERLRRSFRWEEDGLELVSFCNRYLRPFRQAAKLSPAGRSSH
jgi:glycosyltransferase involved in cell wall biosynthesis